MNIEQAKLNIGKEVKFSDSEQFNNEYWKKLVSKGDKVFIDDVINEKNIKVVFKDKDGEIILFWIFELDKFDISLADNIQGMTIEEVENNIGAEIELIEETKPYTKYNVHLCENVTQNEYFEEDFLNAESATLYRVWNRDKLQVQVLLKYKDGTEFNHYLSVRHIRLKIDKKLCGMTIEEAKSHIGAEVELLEHTKPYMNNKRESVANIESNKPSKLIISDVIDGIVKVASPENHLFNLNPEHIALKVIKHIDMESVVLGDGTSMIEKLKKLSKKELSLPDEPLEEQKTPDGVLKVKGENDPWGGSIDYTLDKSKPVNEWNIDDAFYANNHGEEVEAFYDNEWVLLDEMMVAIARGCNKFRIKPKQVFLNAGNYSEEDLLKFISENFR